MIRGVAANTNPRRDNTIENWERNVPMHGRRRGGGGVGRVIVYSYDSNSEEEDETRI